MATLPVITVDGPSGVGKGTISHMLADCLGWHLLDSGALYRVTGQACVLEGVSWDDEPAVADVARHLDIAFSLADNGEMLVAYKGVDVSAAIRTEEGGRGASTVAAIPAVREALFARQRDFLRPPGLVADGRDMGTVVFPDAPLKFFLTASAAERAERRYKQLLEKGESVSLPRLLADIQERDERDSSRSVSPLIPAEDAIVIFAAVVFLTMVIIYQVGMDDMYTVERYNSDKARWRTHCPGADAHKRTASARVAFENRCLATSTREARSRTQLSTSVGNQLGDSSQRRRSSKYWRGATAANRGLTSSALTSGDKHPASTRTSGFTSQIKLADVCVRARLQPPPKPKLVGATTSNTSTGSNPRRRRTSSASSLLSTTTTCVVGLSARTDATAAAVSAAPL